MTLLYLEQLLGPRRKESGLNLSRAGLFEAADGQPPTYVEISENLHFVPSAFRMRETEGVDLGVFEASLRSLLAEGRKYAFVLLDAQAGTDSFARVAASTADQCVIVSEYDPVSAQGIERLKVLFANVLDPSSTWTLFNKVLPEFAKAIGEGLSIARYLTPIPWDADVVRAFARGDLAINMQSPNPYTLAISQVAYDLFPDETGEEIEKWRGQAIETTTGPIESRLVELTTAEHRIEKIVRRQEERKRAFNILSYVLLLLFIGISIIYQFIHSDIIHNSYKISSIFAFLVGVTLIGFITYVTRTFFNMRNDNEKVTLELILEEKAKLKTALDAADAALKFSSAAGIYERGRRVRSQTKDPRSDGKVP